MNQIKFSFSAVVARQYILVRSLLVTSPHSNTGHMTCPFPDSLLSRTHTQACEYASMPTTSKEPKSKHQKGWKEVSKGLAISLMDLRSLSTTLILLYPPCLQCRVRKIRRDSFKLCPCWAFYYKIWGLGPGGRWWWWKVLLPPLLEYQYLF
jgi:hypothetical protein